MIKLKFTLTGSLVFTISISILVSLGIWQLKRSEFKENLQTEHQQQQNLPFAPLPELNKTTDNLYRNVTLTGEFVHQTIFLDNKAEKNKIGYHVFSPFLQLDGSIILVNRGWVAMNIRREILPEIEIPEGTHTLKGQIRNFPEVAYRLEDPKIFNEKWPKVAQFIDQERVDHWFKEKHPAFIIQLAANEAHGFTRNWIVTSKKPEMHIAYAIQWFGMALIVFIIILKRSIVRTRKN